MEVNLFPFTWPASSGLVVPLHNHQNWLFNSLWFLGFVCFFFFHLDISCSNFFIISLSFIWKLFSNRQRCSACSNFTFIPEYFYIMKTRKRPLPGTSSRTHCIPCQLEISVKSWDEQNTHSAFFQVLDILQHRDAFLSLFKWLEQ